jgi:thioredoxin reductase (NADPH)
MPMNIKVYGADWCSDCLIAKKVLKSKDIEFEYIDITNNEQAIALVEQVNNGRRVIPTLVIDGTIYTNPGINELMKILGE